MWSCPPFPSARPTTIPRLKQGTQQHVPLLHSTHHLTATRAANPTPASEAPPAAAAGPPNPPPSTPTSTPPAHPTQLLPSQQQAANSLTAGGPTAPFVSNPRPSRPPKRPVRSRRLQPEPLNPEHPAAFTEFHDPLPTSAWEWALSGTNDTRASYSSSSTHSEAHSELPPAYQCLPSDINLSSSSSSGRWTWSVSPSAPSGTDALRAQGGFLSSRAQVAQLLQPQELPPARALLGLGLDYADHFFCGPDYRYSVDEQGRLVDMVALVRSHLPSRFDRARPAHPTFPQLSESPEPLASLGSAAAMQAAVAAPDADAGAYVDAGGGGGDGNGVDGGAAPADGASAGSAAAAPAAAASAAAAGGGAAAGSLAARQQQQQQQAPRTGRYLVDPSVITDRQQRQDAYLDDGTATATGAASAAGRGGGAGAPVPLQQDGSVHAGGRLEAELIPAESLTSRRSLVARNVGAPLLKAFTQAPPQDKQGAHTSRPVAIPSDLVLRIFTYCIGPTELFQGLWDLELLEQVQYVPRIEDADVVVHRRPQPGEKQFAYNTFRARAKSLGIPFASLWNGSASELQKSLLPVFALYAGLATPEEVTFKAAPRGVKSKRGSKLSSKRIRL